MQEQGTNAVSLSLCLSAKALLNRGRSRQRGQLCNEDGSSLLPVYVR